MFDIIGIKHRLNGVLNSIFRSERWKEFLRDLEAAAAYWDKENEVQTVREILQAMPKNLQEAAYAHYINSAYFKNLRNTARVNWDLFDLLTDNFDRYPPKEKLRKYDQFIKSKIFGDWGRNEGASKQDRIRLASRQSSIILQRLCLLPQNQGCQEYFTFMSSPLYKSWPDIIRAEYGYMGIACIFPIDKRHDMLKDFLQSDLPNWDNSIKAGLITGFLHALLSNKDLTESNKSAVLADSFFHLLDYKIHEELEEKYKFLLIYHNIKLFPPDYLCSKILPRLSNYEIGNTPLLSRSVRSYIQDYQNRRGIIDQFTNSETYKRWDDCNQRTFLTLCITDMPKDVRKQAFLRFINTTMYDGWAKRDQRRFLEAFTDTLPLQIGGICALPLSDGSLFTAAHHAANTNRPIMLQYNAASGISEILGSKNRYPTPDGARTLTKGDKLEGWEAMQPEEQTARLAFVTASLIERARDMNLSADLVEKMKNKIATLAPQGLSADQRKEFTRQMPVNIFRSPSRF